LYYAGVVEPVLVAKITGRSERDPEEKRAYDAMCTRLRGALRNGPYLVGEAFSAADILLESALTWGRAHMPQGTEVDNYVERLSTRPARSRALAKDAAPAA
jgi:glutathione S-transferase